MSAENQFASLDAQNDMHRLAQISASEHINFQDWLSDMAKLEMPKPETKRAPVRRQSVLPAATRV